MSTARRHPCLSRQRQIGVAAMLILFVIAVVAISFLVSSLKSSSSQTERDKITAAALAQAKAALIGFAAGVDLRSGAARPGDLPCPDTNDDGQAESSCNAQATRLGRLPWKTLGLPDLRDGNGERLWYAVSNNFKNNTRTGSLNSDTIGTITVRDASGVIVNDGVQTTGAIAVVISPGASITRQDGLVQTRDAAGSLNPKNYLDILVGTEDNASFIDSNTDGFINGEVLDVGRDTIVNDNLIAIAYGDLMPLLEKRVAGEALSCLTDYAAANQQRYPWAAELNTSLPPDYRDYRAAQFGRLPDPPFTRTQSDSGIMGAAWTIKCNLSPVSGWWVNWKESVFYGMADACKPTAASGCSGTNYLTVNPPSAVSNKQVVVIVAGRQLTGVAGGQLRNSNNDKGTIANYLEDGNLTGLPFQLGKVTPTFNDSVGYR